MRTSLLWSTDIIQRAGTLKADHMFIDGVCPCRMLKTTSYEHRVEPIKRNENLIRPQSSLSPRVCIANPFGLSIQFVLNYYSCYFLSSQMLLYNNFFQHILSI